MVTSLMVFQAIVSVLLILMVLLQFGKGAEAGLMTSASESVLTTGQQGNKRDTEGRAIRIRPGGGPRTPDRGHFTGSGESGLKNDASCEK